VPSIELAGADSAFMSARRYKLAEGYLRLQGEWWMPFDDIAEPEQLAILVAVLDEICLAAGIKPESPESKDAAGLLMHLHRVGCHTADELKTTFQKVTRQAWRA
jgi:hypothetical protein